MSLAMKSGIFADDNTSAAEGNLVDIFFDFFFFFFLALWDLTESGSGELVSTVAGEGKVETVETVASEEEEEVVKGAADVEGIEAESESSESESEL